MNINIKVVAIAAGATVITAGGALLVKKFVFDKKKADNDDSKVDMTDVTQIATAVKLIAEQYDMTISDEQLAQIVVGLGMRAKAMGESRWTSRRVAKEANAFCAKIDGLKEVKFEKQQCFEPNGAESSLKKRAFCFFFFEWS